MEQALVFGVFAAFWWALFAISFVLDRSRYRNCYLLFIAICGTFPLLVWLSPKANLFVVGCGFVIIIALMMVPFFLIFNGIVMVRKEGKSLSHMLSLGLGLAILIGEVATLFIAIVGWATQEPQTEPLINKVAIIDASFFISVTVIYGSLSFLIFMIYTLFLHIIPIKRDFDYIIIHGAGLLDGDRVSKLLRDRLDKAIKVYRKDPTPPKMIPSGGKGSDESISEAEAMKRYLVEQGIPESDIIMEDQSLTTYENIRNSKQIIDEQEGRKYTALVTSNYHVYRALRYCRKVGLKCTGIGSHVAFYFWPSALIREFIAIHSEKKHAIIFIGGWVLFMVVLVMGLI